MLFRLLFSRRSWVILVEHDNGVHSGVRARTHLVGVQTLRAALMEIVEDLDRFSTDRAADLGALRALQELKKQVDKKLAKSKS